MGNKASRVCLSCFSRTKKGQQIAADATVPGSPKEKSGLYLPVDTQEPLVSDTKDDPQSWFDLKSITKALDLTLLDFLKELETPTDRDPRLELLITNTDGFRVYGRETDRGLLLKTNWMVPYTPDEYLAFIRDFEGRKSWDRNLDELRRVCHLSPDISINYQRYKKMMVVSKRELLVACRTIRVGENVMDVSCSVDSHAFPIADDVVRARLYLGGYYLEPSGSSTKITTVNEMDFGGTIPKQVLKRISAIGLVLFSKTLAAALAKAHQSANAQVSIVKGDE